MPRMLIVLSAAALICGSSQIAFADESGMVTGGVGRRRGGRRWRSGRRGRGWRWRRGDRKLRDQSQALLPSRLRQSSLSPPLRLLTIARGSTTPKPKGGVDAKVLWFESAALIAPGPFDLLQAAQR